MGKSIYSPLVPAVEHASRVLICLGKSKSRKLTLTEIIKEVGIHKSRGYSILTTLMQYGLVEKDSQTKTYSLGPGLLFLSRHLLDHMDIRERVSPFLEALAIETRSTALLGLISADQVFVVAKHEGNQNIGITIRLGHRFHITAGAHGKAITAFLSEAEQKRILSRKRLFYYGTAERMDNKLLEEELEQCRERGYSQDLGGLQPGISAVSAPVFGTHENIIGCLILVGTFSGRTVEKYGALTARKAREMSFSIGATPSEERMALGR